MNDLVLFEKQLQPLLPQFEQVLAGAMPVERMARTLIVACERQPKLLECNRQSLINASMTGAVLGLECDGVTGQLYLLPFKGKVQPVIGYKGYNTLGARAHTTIGGEVVREGDTFEYELGTKCFVRHLPKLEGTGRIVAVWASAVPANRPPSVVVMGRNEIDAVMNKSPAVRAKAETPWFDPFIGFPAMASKTAKRRLARSLPLTVFQLAARMDEAFEEQGKHSWIAPDSRVMIEGEVAPLSPTEPSETPTLDDLVSAGSPVAPPTTPPAGSAAPEKSPSSGAATSDHLATAARLKAEIDMLVTERAHTTWARNNTATIKGLPEQLQNDVGDYYYVHKEGAAA